MTSVVVLRRVFFLETNDPDSKTPILVLAGGALHNLIAIKKLNWGTLHLGETEVRRFVLHDPGEGRLQLNGAEWHSSLHQEEPGSPVISNVTWEKVIAYSALARGEGGDSARPGDYLVSLRLAIPEGYSGATFQGSLVINTNLPGSLRQIEVLVVGDVLPDVEVSPPAVFISQNAQKLVAQRVVVRRFGNRELVIEKISQSNELPVIITGPFRLANDSYEMLIALADRPVTSVLRPGSITCHFAGGRRIEIPLFIQNRSRPDE